jgi:two-component system sensor histidine kinase AlgZ
MPWKPGKTFRRDLVQMALVNTVIGISLAMLRVIFSPDSALQNFGSVLTGYLIFSHVIGTLAAIVVPRVAIRLWCRRPLLKWPLFVMTLIAVGVLGAVIANAVLVAAGIQSSTQFRPNLQGSMTLSAVVTIIIGIAVYVFENMRARLEQTTLELRTRELERERALKLAAEAQLTSLQSRLQPHFLFNTINSILALTDEDPHDAQQMLERLSRLLRFALDAQSKSRIPLREELRLVEDYLEIERTRFGDRLRYSINTPPDAADCEVPPYSLQTLVENSVKYAVSTRREGGEVRVRVSRNNGLLHLVVSDDGPGFGREQAAPGHGLDTLQQRLAALYGDKGVLEISNGQGAMVSVTLPADR